VRRNNNTGSAKELVIGTLQPPGDPMSDKTPPTAVPADQPAEESTSTVVTVEKQPNVIVRGFRKIKQTPPKTALAVVGGVGLVALGAALGRSTAAHHIAIVEDDFDPEPIIVHSEVVESNDTQTCFLSFFLSPKTNTKEMT